MYKVVLEFTDRFSRIYDLVFNNSTQQFTLMRRTMNMLPFCLDHRIYNALSINSDNTKEQIKQMIDVGMKKFFFDDGDLRFFVFRDSTLFDLCGAVETERECEERLLTEREIDDYVDTIYNKKRSY